MLAVKRWNKNILHGGILLDQGEVHDVSEVLVAYPASHGVTHIACLLPVHIYLAGIGRNNYAH